jgi:hypothetical protein
LPDDALAGVAGEDEGVGAIGGEGGNPAKLGDAHVLGVVNYLSRVYGGERK